KRWATAHWSEIKGRARIERSWGVRMGIYVVKIAMLMEVNRMSHLWQSRPPERSEAQDFMSNDPPITLSKDSVQEAVDLCRTVSELQYDAYARTSIVKTRFGQMQDKVLNAIRNEGGETTMSKILNRTKLPSKTLKQILGDLELEGAVAQTARKSGGKRPRTTVYWSIVDQERLEAEEERLAIQEDSQPGKGVQNDAEADRPPGKPPAGAPAPPL
ncbi:MAG: hypothetical protein MJA83_03080, partial [Gammaproteobacteria bacterium]|nr:hypothetical protein [Gammaproteobacteria bacterium]